jgi:hypothetical protein
MFFVENATLITSFNFFNVALKFHTLFLYDSPSVFKGVDIPFGTECLVVIVMIMTGDPTLVCFTWLIIPNYRVIGYVHPL